MARRAEKKSFRTGNFFGSFLAVAAKQRCYSDTNTIINERCLQVVLVPAFLALDLLVLRRTQLLFAYF